jgi:phosphate transport system substrate-binding protein
MKHFHPYPALCSLSAALILLSSACTQSHTTSTRNTLETEKATSPIAQSTPAVPQTQWKQAQPAPAKAVAAVPQPVASVANEYSTYEPEVQLSGYLRSIGSDSMDTVMQSWETEFGTTQPMLRFRHEGKGSSTAIPALLEQRADFGPMSRKVRPAEIDRFTETFGYAPTQFPVAIDSLAVYLHPSNPLAQSGLSLDQLKQIFAANTDTPLTRWGQLGLTGKWINAPIHVHGRNAASGTYAFFNSTALDKAGFSDAVQLHPGSASVVDAVSADPYAIGYSGIAYINDSVSAAPLLSDGRAIAANQSNAVSGLYPLSRELYLTLNLAPQGTPSDLQKEFMRFAYSKRGQAIIEEIGYFPIDPARAKTLSQDFN